jgi:hAT family C-terminal dimerisation region
MRVLTVRIPITVNLCVFFFLFSVSFHILFQEANETVFDNIFDSLPVLSAPKKAVLADELTRYLTTPTEAAPDPLLWWIEKQAVYPCLSRMARDYLSIPGTQ